MGITRKIEPKNQKEPDSSAVLHTQSTYPEPLSVNVYSSSSFQNSGDDPPIPPATSSSPLQRLSADPASPAPAFLPNNTHVHVPSNLCPCCVSPSSPSKLQQDTPSQTVAVVSLPLLLLLLLLFLLLLLCFFDLGPDPNPDGNHRCVLFLLFPSHVSACFSHSYSWRVAFLCRHPCPHHPHSLSNL